MWLVAGLGNPGAKYERNRHNVGFRVVDELARRAGASFKGSRLGGDTATAMLTTPRGREKAVLLKPMEFMNLSGFAVQRAAKFHEVEVDRILVVHDEIDLDFGTVRCKAGGGHGGHNGLRSIIEQLGTQDFLRVRVGVGKPGSSAERSSAGGATQEKDVSGWVLSDFPAALARDVDDLVDRSANACEAVLGLGITAAMNQFNTKQPAPRSPQ